MTDRTAPRVCASMLAPSLPLAPELRWLSSAKLAEDEIDDVLVSVGADLFELREAPEYYATLRCGAMAMASMREAPYVPSEASARAARRTRHAMGF